jgi:NAD(P)-dependent dehydrogenase (short-subunit alcohol dehydrogenase family)
VYVAPVRYLVTGANRGIGLELCRQLVARGDGVVAAVRDPSAAGALRAFDPGDGRLVIHACDVADDASVRGLAVALGDAALDVLINNAGVWGGEHQSLRDFDPVEAVRTYEINALGAVRVTIALLPHLRRGTVKKIVHVTSGMGSIEDNTSGGSYGYRMSKAALNMAARSMAVDLRGDGIACAVINPGWVKTDMGGAHAPTPVDDSARGMLAAIDALDLSTSGTFLHWKGRHYPW